MAYDQSDLSLLEANQVLQQLEAEHFASLAAHNQIVASILHRQGTHCAKDNAALRLKEQLGLVQVKAVD